MFTVAVCVCVISAKCHHTPLEKKGEKKGGLEVLIGLFGVSQIWQNWVEEEISEVEALKNVGT